MLSKKLIYVSLFFSFVIFRPDLIYADIIADYRGKLGDTDIGFTIRSKTDSSQISSKLENLEFSYYEFSNLSDRQLHLISRDKNLLILNSLTDSKDITGSFNLNYMSSEEDREKGWSWNSFPEHLTGTWMEKDSVYRLKVELELVQMVDGSNGGRCNLDFDQYQSLQNRIKKFQNAVKDNNKVTLKVEFKFDLPSSSRWRKGVVDAIPHNLFCNSQGFMLGSGFVWFNSAGKITKVNLK